MRKLLFFLFLFLFPFSVFASTSKSEIILDVDSGRVLYEKNVHEKKLIASTTKIMTCIVVLENVDIESSITVGDEVLSMYGTNIYIEPGEVMSVKDLLYGLMLRSGNDAAMTLAVNTFGSLDAFVSKMNEKAKEIGMKDTIFSNPTGLDDENENYSTAYDMALLSQYAYHNSIYRGIVSTKKYSAKSSIKSYLWYNRVSLLSSYRKCIGGKNGYTPKAGKTLVSLAKDGDMVLTIVSLNDSNIYDNHQRLYNEYFERFHRYKIIDKDHFSIDSSLVKNQIFYIEDSFYYPLMDDELSHISTSIKINSNQNKYSGGEISIKLNDTEIGKIPVYLSEKKEETSKGFFSWFKKLFV